MVIFKDSAAKVGRVRLAKTEQKSQLRLPVFSEPDRRLRFMYKNGYFHFEGKKITKQHAFQLAKWILSHE